MPLRTGAAATGLAPISVIAIVLHGLARKIGKMLRRTENGRFRLTYAKYG